MSIALNSRRRIADWLSLGAAPSFAAMAVVAAMAGDGHPPMHGVSELMLGGMPTMYLLMSLFHLPPWFRLAPIWRGTAPRRGGTPAAS